MKGLLVCTTLTPSLGFFSMLRDGAAADSNNLKEKCENLGKLYSSDFNGHQLYEDILDCRMLLSSRPNLKISRPEELLEFIVQYGDENVFPNLRIAIQIILTIAVSIANCERSFSRLKLILSYLRASMGQGRLRSCSAECRKRRN